MILFCLPYAGGSEAIYFKWKRYLDTSIQLYPVELKGRGKRYGDTFYETLEEAVEDIFRNIKDKIMCNDYAIYGHSMGSLLAYELYYKIKEQNVRIPIHIFCSGHKAPSTIAKKEAISTLPDYDFMKKVMELGGTPGEIMNNSELFQLFLPILRNDFRILEYYRYKNKEDKIECKLSIFNGKQDSIKFEELAAWRSHAGNGVKFYNLEGNHFFINDNTENIINIINNTLVQ